MTRKYIGTKIINANPMTRQAYNDLRGWTLPADENGDDSGFLVEYLDGGEANVEGFAGYVSWSPSDVFERAYRPCESMTFGAALEALKASQRVARVGWNGKGMWLMLVPEALAEAVSFQYAALKPAPWIGMKTADEKFVPWLASQTDMLAEDWEIIQ